MNFVFTVIDPPREKDYLNILKRLELPVSLLMHGHGTVEKNTLGLLGLETKQRRAIFTVAGEQATQRLMQAVKRELYIDAPGNGVSVAVPIKSVGGAKTLEFLSGNEPAVTANPKEGFKNELIVAISNEGYSDNVMEAARNAGARGGTVLHGKGTAKGELAKFYNVTISEEKEIILIVTRAEDKNGIMSAIIHEWGPASKAGTIVFSLPVSAAMGLKMLED